MDNVINIINTAVCTGLPGGSDVKNLPANAWDTGGTGSILESGRSPGGGSGTPIQYSWLEDPIDRGAWRVTVHGIAKSWTWLSTHACMLYMKIEKILSSYLKEKKIISISLILYLYEMMNMYEIYGEKHFIIYVSHMIMLYILNLQYCVSIISRHSRS